MKESKIETVIVGQNSNVQPIQGEPPLTLKLVNKKIDIAIKKAIKKAKITTSQEISKQVQTDKASLITVFGIFASIISFLTIEFQFLRTTCSFEKLLGFTLVLASLLLCFNLALDYLVKSRTDSETPKPNIIFSFFIIIIFIFGNYYISLGNEEVCKDNKIYEKYSDKFDDQQKEFNQDFFVKQKIKDDQFNIKILEIEQKINQIK
jgi:heme/copper-type cytochrome/quinol oxidase subunit 4